jgi:predicted nucleotidyltransferase
MGVTLRADDGSESSVAPDVPGLVASLLREFAPGVADLVVIFGSVAHGTARPGSDVDVLIDGPVVNRPRDVARIRGRLAETLGRDVDVVTLAVAHGNPMTLVDALEHGRVLVDRAETWARLQSLAGDLREAAAAARAENLRRGNDALATLRTP